MEISLPFLSTVCQFRSEEIFEYFNYIHLGKCQQDKMSQCLSFIDHGIGIYRLYHYQIIQSTLEDISNSCTYMSYARNRWRRFIELKTF